MLAVFAVGAGSRVQAQGGQDAVAGLRNAWMQALQQHDVEGAVALYEPDAIFLSGDGNRFPDRAAIRTLYRSLFQSYTAKVSMTSGKQDCAGALCVDTGTYSEAVTETSTGRQLASHGSYVLVARREGDREWKIEEMVWTGAAPSPVK